MYLDVNIFYCMMFWLDDEGFGSMTKNVEG